MPNDIVRETGRRAKVAPWVLFGKYFSDIPSLVAPKYSSWFNQGEIPEGMTDWLLDQYWSKKESIMVQ